MVRSFAFALGRHLPVKGSVCPGAHESAHGAPAYVRTLPLQQVGATGAGNQVARAQRHRLALVGMSGAAEWPMRAWLGGAGAVDGVWEGALERARLPADGGQCRQTFAVLLRYRTSWEGELCWSADISLDVVDP